MVRAKASVDLSALETTDVAATSLVNLTLNLGWKGPRHRQRQVTHPRRV